MRGHWIAAWAALGAACAAPPPAPVAKSSSADLSPAFEALEEAVDAGDDALARRILARIQALGPGGKAAELLRAYDRILDGRDLARSVHMHLECRSGEREGTGELVLVIEPALKGEIELLAQAAMLGSSIYGVDARGREFRSARTESRSELEELTLEGGKRREVSLAQYSLPVRGELAVRAQFRLELIQPELVRDGERVPVAGLAIEPCEVLNLAPRIVREPADPRALARLIATPGFSLAEALEQCVRIPASERDAALDQIAPIVERLNRIDLERAAPCLRWLSGERELGAEPEGWRRWMAERARERQDSQRARDGEPDLVLPDPTPGAAPQGHPQRPPSLP